MTDEEQPDDNPMDDEDNKTEDEAKHKDRCIYKPLVYCNNTTGKTYYYKYFKLYSHDYRRLKGWVLHH